MDLIGEKMLCFKGNIRESDMSALDGKITIEKELRPCIVHIPSVRGTYHKGEYLVSRIIEPEHDIKALFHC